MALQASDQQEQLRQQYLAAMGITPWLPRRVLPGAAPSPVWRWSEAEPEVGADSGRDAGEALAAPVASAALPVRRPLPDNAPLRQLLAGKPELKPATESLIPQPTAEAPVTRGQAAEVSAEPLSRPRQDAAVPAVVGETELAAPPPESAPAVTAVPRFKLALVAYADCMVISDLPVSHAQPWTETHQQLLNRIVTAVGLAGDSQRMLGYREFHWPLDPVAGFDQSEAVARLALAAELQAMQQAEPALLLLMGQHAARYLLPVGQDAEAGTLIDVKNGSALCCHGLNEVLRLPGLKAELWRQLQPLRRLPPAATRTPAAH